MSFHKIDAVSLLTAIHLLERTYVGVGDQDDLFKTLRAMRASLSTPVNSDGSTPVIALSQRVSP